MSLRARRPKPMLITFSGLDGAGKSTLIEWLCRELRQRDRPVTVLHMPDSVGVYAGLRIVRDGLRRLAHGPSGGAPNRPPWMGQQRAPGFRGFPGRIRDAVIWSKVVRRVIYPLDLLIFLAIRFVVETVRRRVLVTDRYFYDTLVDIADDGRWFWVRFLERLTPLPDVPVFLDVSPEEAYARKSEYSISYLTRRSVAYRAVAPLVPSAVVLRNADGDETRRALAQALRERLGS